MSALIFATPSRPGAAGVRSGLAERALTQLRAAADSRQAFEYEVGMANPHRHEFELSLRFVGVPGDRATLELPKWNPGAYRLTHAHRNLRAVAARKLDARGRVLDDQLLPISKLDENTWEVAHEGQPFAVEYRVYCGRYRGIGSCYLDDAMGFFNGVHLFMYAVDHKQRPIELRVHDLPGGRQAEVVTGLPRRGSGGKAHFWAANFDALVDSPVHAGEVDTVELELGGKPIRVVMSAEGAWEAEELREEIGKITETSAAVFGPLQTALPFSDYSFIYHVLPDARGGLEHRNSTVIGVDPWAFETNEGKRRFWSVTAHEFFHLWNVKRIRPAVLGPFDYDREVHTTMLWFSEGFTSYYAALILSRSGLVDEDHTLDEFARRIAAFATRPGRKLLSVEQSSWETWARPDDGRNAYFSYYDKGMALGMLLDLHLRKVSKGQRSTDTVFQELWQRWRDTGLGLTPAELEQVFVDQAGGEDSPGGQEVRAMFRDYVHGTAELDYDRYLAHAGYALERSIVDEGAPWLGIDVRWREGELQVDSVIHGGPADAGGLGSGDVIVAIDDHRIDERSTYDDILAALELGEAATITVSRMGRVLDLQVSPVACRDEDLQIVELEDVSAEQMVLRKAWLGLED